MVTILFVDVRGMWYPRISSLVIYLVQFMFHIMIDTFATVDFWKIVEKAFIRSRNKTFDRHVFLITKKLRGETVEHFYGKLKLLAEKYVRLWKQGRDPDTRRFHH